MAETPPGSGGGERHWSRKEVNGILACGAIIERAKGVLMFHYDVDADRAFEMLLSRSRQVRVKVRQLAEQILANPAIAKTFWD